MTLHPASRDRARLCVWAAAVLFASVTIGVSWFRWATFQLHTFDLAFYVQALWLMVHGKFFVTLLNVPLMGNHAEPIVFLLAPLFAVVPHPMLPAIVQNIAIATMGPCAYRIARNQGLEPTASAFLALGLLLAPATSFVALHEFHPEAFAAPLLLLLFSARLDRKLGWFWVFFLLALGCKENIALLLITYCVVEAFRNRQAPSGDLARWCIAPAALAVVWLLFYSIILGPALNRGNVDYSELYSHLGSSGVLAALYQSLSQGNLLWGALLPFLFLPAFRPSWLLVAAPILLQHLLSWRSAEWSIRLHYAAPLIPIFWVATLATLAALRGPFQTRLALGILIASIASQACFGPLRQLIKESIREPLATRDLKSSFVALVPKDASVVAGLPYLSHLALREELFSLHHILKGLKTLSRATYSPPPPTDFVLADYGDSATFDPSAGYYHPVMRTADNRVIPSSDQLFHEWLKSESWVTTSVNEVTLFQKAQHSTLEETGQLVARLDTQTDLVSLRVIESNTVSDLELVWRFHGERTTFPWLYLCLFDGKAFTWINKGLCAPQASTGLYRELWRLSGVASPGKYNGEAVFVDNSTMAWSKSKEPSANMQSSILLRVSTGPITIPAAK